MQRFWRNETQKNQAGKIFFAICLIHLLIWTILPSIMIHNPPTDSLEGLAWGRLWLWGYPKHPFLAPWLTAIVSDLFGTIGWPIYLLAQACCVACFWGIWRLANQLLNPWQALISASLLTCVHYFNISAYIFDPNVLMLPMWAWLGFYFYQSVNQQRLRYWIFTGIFAGLALISKYESGLLILLLFLLLFTSAMGRASWKRPGVYIAAIFALLIFSPNLHYLYQHHFNAVNYALAEMAKPADSFWHNLFRRFYRPFYFLINHFLFLLPWFILLLPFYRSCYPNLLRSFTLFQRQFILILGLGPILFTVIVAIIMNAALVQRWGFPFFCFSGILLVSWLNPQIQIHQVKRFLKIWAAIFVFTAIAFVAINSLQPKLSKPHKGKVHSNFPGRQVTKEVLQQWRNYCQQPLVYIAGDVQYVSNIVSFAPTKMIPFFLSDINQSPWISLTEFNKTGAVFVYPLQTEHDQAVIESVKINFPGINQEIVLETPALPPAKSLKVKYWLGFSPPSNM